MCRSNGDLTNTAFIAKPPGGGCILLSAFYCFLEEGEEEEEESSVASEEELAQLGVTRRSKMAKKSNEIELQSDNPTEQMID